MKNIALTTSVPVEVLLAKGYTPVDLNNIFITDDNYSKYIDIAEKDGFPKSVCAWIKGIYGVCIINGIDEILGPVVQEPFRYLLLDHLFDDPLLKGVIPNLRGVLCRDYDGIDPDRPVVVILYGYLGFSVRAEKIQ